MLLCHTLPYLNDNTCYFDGFAGTPWALYLDSGEQPSRYRHFDILTAAPLTTLVCRGSVTTIETSGGIEESEEEPLMLLRQQLSRYHTTTDQGYPFTGGAIGYLGYDLAQRTLGIGSIQENRSDLPEMAVAIFGWALLIDHQRAAVTLVGQGDVPEVVGEWEALCARFAAVEEGTARSELSPSLDSVVESNMDESAYKRAFEAIQHYLFEGDCYQVNLAQRFTARYEGEGWPLYRRLRQINSAPFGAYLELPFATIMSNSPEQFLRLDGDRVTTSPIKGTRPRLDDPVADRAIGEALCASIKDRAENLMIVDLLRNDLGKVCRPGSIEVEALFALESHATVHHLVSHIGGELLPEHDAIDLLDACFPGGSITGAPKRRAMEIIEELEPQRRGVYCGSIIALGFDGNLNSSIAIRTLLHSGGRLTYHAGGGIVVDSNWQDEYRESLDKAKAFFQLFDGDRPEVRDGGGENHE